MRLKDFVFNSLRVRGKKKKASPIATTDPSDISTGCFGLDKNRNWFLSSGSRLKSRDSSLEGSDFGDANWQGNALYQGLISANRNSDVNSSSKTSDLSSNCGVIYSPSSGRFSTTQTKTLNKWRGETFDSYGSASPVSNMSLEPLLSQKYFYHDHTDEQRNYQNHQTRDEDMCPLVPSQKEIDFNTASGKQLKAHHKPHNVAKSESGFFRKSIASFRGMCKHGNKHKGFFPKQTSADNMASPIYAPLESKGANEIVYSDKKFIKIKKKGTKSFLKSKETRNRALSLDNFENPWSIDDISNSSSMYIKDRGYSVDSTFRRNDNSYIWGCSKESFPSRHYTFRDDVSVRDLDLVSFESTSLSGYESDFSRGKFHKSRSRIKTNPWLPSPQLSHSYGSHGDSELRESKENIFLIDEQYPINSRHSSSEERQTEPMSFQKRARSELNSPNRRRTNCRSLSPCNTRMTLNLIPPNAPSLFQTNPAGKSQADLYTINARTPALNDLSNTQPRSRPTSIVSPNSEFVMLAENLEQLANNIGFEYDDALNTTLESVTIGKENQPTFTQEKRVFEENDNIQQQFPNSDSQSHFAHSPDSGVGGLGYSEGDSLSPAAQYESKVSRLQNVSSEPVYILGKSFGSQPEDTYSYAKSNNTLDSHRNTYSGVSETLENGKFDNQHSRLLSRSTSSNSQPLPIRDKRKNPKRNVLDTEDSTASCKQTTGTTSAERENNENEVNSKKQVISKTNEVGGPNQRTLVTDKCDDDTCQSDSTCGIIFDHVTPERDRSHLISSRKQTLQTATDFDNDICCKIPRPSDFRTKQSAQAKSKKMKDTEKMSDQLMLRSSWMDEFDFPRNITSSECLESPTENWHWDNQLSMGIDNSQDMPVTNLQTQQHFGCQQQEAEIRGYDNRGYDNRCFYSDESVKLVELENTVTPQTSQTLCPPSCSFNQSDDGSTGTSFQMNDACVQTEFDDDDDDGDWDEADILQDIEADSLHPFDDCWLSSLSDNENAYSITDLCSLPNDSMILTDDEDFNWFTETRERPPDEGIHSRNMCCNNLQLNMTSRDSLCLATELHSIPFVKDHDTSLVSTTESKFIQNFNQGQGRCDASMNIQDIQSSPLQICESNFKPIDSSNFAFLNTQIQCSNAVGRSTVKDNTVIESKGTCPVNYSVPTSISVNTPNIGIHKTQQNYGASNRGDNQFSNVDSNGNILQSRQESDMVLTSYQLYDSTNVNNFNKDMTISPGTLANSQKLYISKRASSFSEVGIDSMSFPSNVTRVTQLCSGSKSDLSSRDTLYDISAAYSTEKAREHCKIKFSLKEKKHDNILALNQSDMSHFATQYYDRIVNNNADNFDNSLSENENSTVCISDNSVYTTSSPNSVDNGSIILPKPSTSQHNHSSASSARLQISSASREKSSTETSQSLTEKVKFLCQTQSLVLQKIQAAQQEEMSRQEQRIMIQKLTSSEERRSVADSA